jgi:hypothetical protein
MVSWLGDEIPLLRNSERGDFNRCPWLWYQHWVEGWTPDRPPTWSVFGGAMHKALEVRYPPGRKRGRLEDAQQAFLDCLDGEIRKVGVDIFEEEYAREEEKAEAADRPVKLVPAHELGPIMLAEYVKKYGEDDEWEVIHNEQPFQIDVPYPKDWGARFAGRTLVVYCGTWDVLMRHRRTGEYWLWDWKTCRQFPNVAWLEMADQPGSYLWVAKEVLVHKGLLSRKDRIVGIYFQYLKKSLPDPRPRNAAGEALNKDGTVSKKQPAERFLRYDSRRSPEQIVRQARRVQDSAIAMEMMRNGELPIYKNVTHDCPRCIIFDMCTAHEAGDDWELLRDQLYVVRDGYTDHREAMQRGGIEL